MEKQNPKFPHKAVQKFLAKHKTASLATVCPQHQPHSANVQYASTHSYQFYYVSKPEAAHSQHIQTNAHAAITVYAHTKIAATIHGVQLHGKLCALETQSQIDHAFKIYSQKFGFAKLPPFKQKILDQTFYCFTPTWIRFIDNRVRFGYRSEINLSPDAEPSPS